MSTWEARRPAVELKVTWKRPILEGFAGFLPRAFCRFFSRISTSFVTRNGTKWHLPSSVVTISGATCYFADSFVVFELIIKCWTRNARPRARHAVMKKRSQEAKHFSSKISESLREWPRELLYTALSSLMYITPPYDCTQQGKGN
jgi:hypothetical protein